MAKKKNTTLKKTIIIFISIVVTILLIFSFTKFQKSQPIDSSTNTKNFSFKFHGPTQDTLWAGTNNGDIFDEPDEKIDEMLEQMAKSDLRVLRIMIDFRLEMDTNGNPRSVGSYDECILNKINDLMVKAKQKGILLLITLEQYNWINSTPYSVSVETHGWRKCKTPVNVYNRSLTEGVQTVYGPYYTRLQEWGGNYLTSTAAKDAYKQRVSHILNHRNPYFSNKRWKDINDVVWAWALHSEPELLYSFSTTNLRNWFNEMATYVKSIDPDTYVVLGNRDHREGLGNITDTDIYTLHAYSMSSESLTRTIENFNKQIGIPYNKLLLIEEFNPFVAPARTPGDMNLEKKFEDIMETSRKNGVPWMFWEYGYKYERGPGADDIWHKNHNPENPDGIFWGAKILPGAKKTWNTAANNDKRWNVHQMAGDLCSQEGASCNTGKRVIFLDTFSQGAIDPIYRRFDEGNADEYRIEDGHLKIITGLHEDLWGGTPIKRGAPLLLYQAPEGDYEVETFVRSRQIGHPWLLPNTQMGLFIFHDINNWIFFGLNKHDFTINGARSRGEGLMVTYTNDDYSHILTQHSIAEDFAFLKIKKIGNNVELYWKKQNGENWNFLVGFSLPAEGRHEVGMGVKTFGYNGTYGYFDYFSIKK